MKILYGKHKTTFFLSRYKNGIVEHANDMKELIALINAPVKQPLLINLWFPINFDHISKELDIKRDIYLEPHFPSFWNEKKIKEMKDSMYRHQSHIVFLGDIRDSGKTLTDNDIISILGDMDYEWLYWSVSEYKDLLVNCILNSRKV